MMQQRALWIGFSLLVGAMIGASIVLVGFSADARTRHHYGLHSMPSAPAKIFTPEPNQNAPHRAQKSEEHSTPNSETAPDKANDAQPGRHSIGVGRGSGEGKAGSAATGPGAKEGNFPSLKDLGPVDARITIVQPRRHGAKAEMSQAASSKGKPKTSTYFRTRHAFIQHNVIPVVRNTIGVPIAPQSVIPGRDRVTVGVKESPGNGVIRTGRDVGAAGPFRPNGGNGPLANRGAISGTIGGTSFPHRGFAPAALGGQTKTTGGLNGSMIRPKY